MACIFRVPSCVLVATLFAAGKAIHGHYIREADMTSKVERMQPELAVPIFEGGRWEFKGTEYGEEEFQPFFIRLYFGEINIRSEEPLPVAFDIRPVENDSAVIIFSDIFGAAE